MDVRHLCCYLLLPHTGRLALQDWATHVAWRRNSRLILSEAVEYFRPRRLQRAVLAWKRSLPFHIVGNFVRLHLQLRARRMFDAWWLYVALCTGRASKPEQKVMQQLKDIIVSQKRTLFSKQIKSVRDLFDAIDADHSSEITIDELAVAMRRLDVGVREAEIIDVFTRMADGNGSIRYLDFALAIGAA
ncbi:hypothetical protein CYMTET_54966 [Cymbomonas tetramitiformis]|uniref:EF-hand domain-containing protein n=1 Tax=Cymbomonas tetramitiformis TaxID=36881 RepID=A0AAE0BFN9_9CHLO|nr:hypothetical protein CYMTET_54966 [Cymbomonas tetramitiformis]